MMERDDVTPLDRWRDVLEGGKPHRVPMDYWGTQEATSKLLKFLGCEKENELYERLHIDKLLIVGPDYTGPPIEKDTDMYGCRYEDISYGTGVYRECIHHPLASYASADEIREKYKWPTVDWFDHSGIRSQIEGIEAYPLRGGGSEPFLIYKRLRGQEQAFMDLILHPEIVHYCLDELYQFCYQNTARIYEQIPGAVLITYVSEDMGSQQNLMFSPSQIREFFIPRMKDMIDLVHQAGAYAFFHSDGAIREIIPEMIEIGIDILNPIQWRCRGMDRKQLKRDFGGKVIFHGGMDNQKTLAFDSVEDVKAEVLYNLDVLGRDGGYILAPCHNIQAVSPPENIVAMYETGYEFGGT